MARLAIWLKIIPCFLNWAAAAPPVGPEEVLGLTTPGDPNFLTKDHWDAFGNLDSACDPHSDASDWQPRMTDECVSLADHFVPMEFRPSEEKAYYREGVQSNNILIQAPAQSVAPPESSEPARVVEPSGRNERSGLKRAYTDDIQPLTENAAHSQSSGTLGQAGPHDGQRQVARPDQPLIHQTSTPMQTGAPLEASQTISEAEPNGSKPVGSNKRLRVDQQIQTPINQATQTPTTSAPHPQRSLSTSDPISQPNRPYEDNETPTRVTKGADLRYFGSKGPNMRMLERRATLALKFQDHLAKKEFNVFTAMLNQKYHEINVLYSNSLSVPSSDTLTKIYDGLEMSVRNLGLPLNFGEHYFRIIDIRIPLKSKTQARKYLPMFLKIQAILKALNHYHNLVFLNGLDQKILKRENAGHPGPLPWFYEQLFYDTPAHPPLLGMATMQLEEISPNTRFTEAHYNVYRPPLSALRGIRKNFNEAQKRLYYVLVEPVQLSSFNAGIVALDLLGHWYRAEFSKLWADPFPAVDYAKELAGAVEIVSQ
ncbi:hypothetical protein PTTG_12727 [Puccinia triticina 1-1 BBBD Race 1]|uniref:Uncharacterized protein n=1 Tax=Puccinia triticina (isolate 1-1 / race 1 (BBBD)) TaxID=630390 RepID=A0A180GAH5_PUCT1|nr:hypothetical protein PTTG_12727 [Puccinia triticina 1-1 BBBD Race 1]